MIHSVVGVECVTPSLQQCQSLRLGTAEARCAPEVFTRASTGAGLPEHRRSSSEDIIEKEEVMNSFNRESKNNKNRREFLKNGMVAAGAATLGTGLFSRGAHPLSEKEKKKGGKISKGDTAMLNLFAPPAR